MNLGSAPHRQRISLGYVSDPRPNASPSSAGELIPHGQGLWVAEVDGDNQHRHNAALGQPPVGRVSKLAGRND